jgi:hypothetical protein
MIQDWFRLQRYPIVVPGKSQIVLRAYFLWLAIRYPKRDKFLTVSQSRDSHGIVWNNFNQWLRFQISYIDERKWAASPIIRAVTLVNTLDFEQSDLTRVPLEMHQVIEGAVERYIKVFDGIEEQQLRNWFTRNYLLCDAFSETETNPIKDSGTFLEVGAGLGGVLSLAVLRGHKKIYSCDTVEMQEVYSALIHTFSPESNQLQMVPVNISDNSLLNVDVDNLDNIIAFWSFTELKHEDRKKYTGLFNKATRIYVACNEHFEGIDNFEYLENLAKELNMKIKHKTLGQIFHSFIPGYQKKHRVYLLYR